MKAGELLLEIRGDTSSGASDIMKRGVEAFKAFSEASDAKDPREYFKSMVCFGRELIGAQPSMAPLFNAVNIILFKLEVGINRGDKIIQMKRAVDSAASEIQSTSKSALDRIKKEAGKLIENRHTILTHSYSATVIDSLVFAHQKGSLFGVIATESRPLFEGRRTAQLLSEAGIEVTLIADMAAFYLLDDVDIILTGCDCVCENGVVNKVGTKGLAIAAAQFNVPFYVLCERNKFLSSRYLKEPKIEEKDPREILEIPSVIAVKNMYFDITPHRFITDMITEDGIVSCDEIHSLLAQIPLSRALIEQ
ncbi:MAG: translation initiation factor eIF-2B [Thermoplasmata archaeon]|nr:MAG: translation initiation factor eIF-2B [Thermoplasmata archaeon]